MWISSFHLSAKPSTGIIEFSVRTSGRHSIAFISKKVYQRNAQPVNDDKRNALPGLAEFNDLT
jgi:hypothetical protein